MTIFLFIAESDGIRWSLCFTPVCPKSLHYICKLECNRGHKCRSVNFTRDGDLLVCCSELACLFDMDKYAQKFGKIIRGSGNMFSLIEGNFKNTHSMLAMMKHQGEVFRLDNFLEGEERLFTVEKAFSKGSTKLCVLHDMMILTNCGCDITIISMSDNPRRDYDIPNTTCITSLCIHKNGHLLTLDSKQGRISMHHVSKTAELRQVWSLDNFEEALAICTDRKTGLIFVTGRENTLHIISSQGGSARGSALCTQETPRYA